MLNCDIVESEFVFHFRTNFLGKDMNPFIPLPTIVLRLGLIEYVDCTSTEEYDLFSNECPKYDTKPSDSLTSALELRGNLEYPFNAITSGPTLTWSGGTC